MFVEKFSMFKKDATEYLAEGWKEFHQRLILGISKGVRNNLYNFKGNKLHYNYRTLCNPYDFPVWIGHKTNTGRVLAKINPNRLKFDQKVTTKSNLT